MSLQEHLASVQDLSSTSVKQELRKHLKSSGSALKLQNLAYSLRHGLLLPFDAEQVCSSLPPEQSCYCSILIIFRCIQASHLDQSAAERSRARLGVKQDAKTTVSLPPEPATASEVSMRAPQTPECVSQSAPPVSADSPLRTTFSLQERVSASPAAGLATQSTLPGKLAASPQALRGEADGGNGTNDAPLQHGDSALPTKELHEATRQAHQHAKQPPVRTTSIHTLHIASRSVRSLRNILLYSRTTQRAMQHSDCSDRSTSHHTESCMCAHGVTFGTSKTEISGHVVEFFLLSSACGALSALPVSEGPLIAHLTACHGDNSHSCGYGACRSLRSFSC